MGLDGLDTPFWDEDALHAIPFDGAPPFVASEPGEQSDERMKELEREPDEQRIEDTAHSHLRGWDATAQCWVWPPSNLQLRPCSPPASLLGVQFVPVDSAVAGYGVAPGPNSTGIPWPTAPPVVNPAGLAPDLYDIPEDEDDNSSSPARRRPASKKMRTPKTQPSSGDLGVERRRRIWKRKEKEAIKRVRKLERLRLEEFEKAQVFRARRYGMG